ncbi:hypothetical protein C8R44DRAFT_890505 [Mycena epipterygia]|nr:hypothetical protein C8R44DRAFT_890505 [Mycena epipterygia]
MLGLAFDPTTPVDNLICDIFNPAVFVPTTQIASAQTVPSCPSRAALGAVFGFEEVHRLLSKHWAGTGGVPPPLEPPCVPRDRPSSGASMPLSRMPLVLLQALDEQNTKLIHRVMVHGQLSLGENSKPDPKANGTKYGVSEATDHWLELWSDSSCLQTKFGSPRAHYRHKMGRRLLYISKILASNPDAPSIKNIFRTFNKHVFAGVPKTAGNTNEVDEDEDVEDKINAAMHRLASGGFDDDNESDGNGSIGRRHLRQVRFAGGPPQVQDNRQPGSQENGKAKRKA